MMWEFFNRNMGEMVGIILASLLAITVLGGIYLSNIHDEKMASMGYVEVQKIGAASTLWVKEK